MKPTLHPHAAGQAPAAFDFSKAPLLVIWESTRSCALACDHCRANADTTIHPDELKTEEGYKLIDQVVEMGTPIMVLSGGDPLNRKDLEDLVRYGKSKGLRMGTIPAATDQLTRERLLSLKEAGLDQVAFSIDGPDAESHDRFRRTPGAFAKVLQGVKWAHELGLAVQINTCLGAWNYKSFPAILDLVAAMPIAFWEVFFLIPVGRGASLGGLTPDEIEVVYERLHRLTKEKDFVVKLTEGQPFRRYVMMAEAKAGAGHAERTEHSVARAANVRMGIKMPNRAVNAGDGFMFVDHLGGICPSGFLPTVRGNVRRTTLAEVYRNDQLFRDLRDHSKLKGKCGVCEFREPCGGSRARAAAVTGDIHATDESCAYVPASLRVKAA